MSVLESIWGRIQNEPVLVTTFIGAIIALFVAFGVQISDDQKVAIIGLATALLAFFARSKVSPV